ncbi:hypothetical protein V5O48_009885 [Marasmius crinis-equi]|uniref:AB hydrolase-1 domain-containing protein n=1 Tax=Marasmius crinis-equi TaxID=585013 RepID=A0ABR3F9V9_9AGAR
MHLSFPSLLTILALLPTAFGVTVGLDPRNYKNATVSRGIQYSYYLSPPTDNKRFVLLLHGWPGLSYDWRFQVDALQEAGYGVIVPDMLGYGRTAKPTDPEFYKSSLVTRDIVDILDAESVGNDVVVVGHDWGSKVTSRLANWFPERFSAFGFVTIAYLPPSFFSTPYNESNALSKAVFGFEVYGYWDFFARPGAHEVVEEHLESVLSLIHTTDPLDTIKYFQPLGVLEAAAKQDRKASSAAWTPEEEQYYLEAYRAPGSVEASLAWYKVVVSDIEAKDIESIPPQNLVLKKPVFYGAALTDFFGVAPQGIQFTLNSTVNSTIRIYDAGHWAHWVKKEEVNRDLVAWIEGL